MRNEEDWTEADFLSAQRALGYTFCDRELLKTCFTHKTYANNRGGESNERLEFLGDAVLQLCVTETLYRGNGSDEGALTDLRKQYVSKEALELAEKKAGLMPYLRYSGGENNLAGKTPSNLFEAVTAGIYLDGGMAEARKFLERFLTEDKTDNYKSRLQEYAQEREKKTPEYAVREEEGRFVCTVRALGKEARGEGESKKAAEKEAAKALLEIISERTEH